MIAARALFESDLWQAWCGDELRIIDGQGRLARVETARTVLDSVPPGWLKTDDGWQKIVLEHEHSWRTEGDGELEEFRSVCEDCGEVAP